MKVLIASGLILLAIVAASAAPQAAQTKPATAPAANPPVIEPIIDWGKCPQLAPTDQQRKAKTEIIKSCLELNPLNVSQEQLNAEIVEKHRIKLGECALTKEDWVSLSLQSVDWLMPQKLIISQNFQFNADKTYKYDKAEDELKKKDVEEALKTKILEQHKQCKAQGLEKFSAQNVIIEQVQFYQSCMDFHVSQLCNIKIMLPPQ